MKILGNVMIGYTQSCIECEICKIKRSIKLEAFYNISLEIEANNIYSLEDALKRYETHEYLQNVNCQFCSINRFVVRKEALIRKVKSRESIKEETKKVMLMSLEKLVKYTEKLKVIEQEIEQINVNMCRFIDDMAKDLVPLF